MASDAPGVDRVACPVCAALSLRVVGAQEVCPVCGWQDDPDQRARPDLADGPNGGVDLREARAHFADYGVALPRSEVGGS